jgi:hypothetical protein
MREDIIYHYREIAREAQSLEREDLEDLEKMNSKKNPLFLSRVVEQK